MEHPAQLDWDRALRQCVHCGLCLQACPTYRLLGTEADSGRGRLHLLRAVAEGRSPLTTGIAEHLDLCLACRACEGACPSGVPYGKLYEHARPLVTARRARGASSVITGLLSRYVLPYSRALRIAAAPAALAQRAASLANASGSLGLLDDLLGIMPERSVPGPPPGVYRTTEPRARVMLWRCCVTDALLAQVEWASLRVLLRNGCEVVMPARQVCCGALALHEGDVKRAQRFARINVEALRRLQVDAIVADAAGCGALLKEYGTLLADEPKYSRRAAELAAKTMDINEFLHRLGPARPEHSLEVTVTYHDACHLAHAQGIRDEPRALLRSIDGLRLVEMKDSDLCCGSAGTYGLRHIEIGRKLRERKVDNALSTGARIIVSPNIGCTLQIMSGLRRRGHSGAPKGGKTIPVLHPVELLDAAYSGTSPL